MPQIDGSIGSLLATAATGSGHVPDALDLARGGRTQSGVPGHVFQPSGAGATQMEILRGSSATTSGLGHTMRPASPAAA
jgi:hypothetical protein